jgi:hypothetical protein
MRARSLQNQVLPEKEPDSVSRRLSLRRMLLQVLGAALIALAGVIDWLNGSDPAVSATPLFFLTLGIIVFVTGFVMQRAGRLVTLRSETALPEYGRIRCGCC